MSDAKLSPFSTAAMPPSSTGMSPMSSYTLLLFTLSLAQFTETVYSQPYGLDIEGSFAAVFHIFVSTSSTASSMSSLLSVTPFTARNMNLPKRLQNSSKAPFSRSAMRAMSLLNFLRCRLSCLCCLRRPLCHLYTLNRTLFIKLTRAYAPDTRVRPALKNQNNA